MTKIPIGVPLEIRSSVAEEPEVHVPEVEEKTERPKRRAAEEVKEKIRRWIEDEG